MKLSQTLLGAAVAAATLIGAPAFAAGIQFNIIEADTPTNNSFIKSTVFDKYGVKDLGFGLVQSADVKGKRRKGNAFWYVYEDSGFKNDFHISSAGVDIGETSPFDSWTDAFCGTLNGDWDNDCHDRGKLAKGHYQGDDMMFKSNKGIDAGLGDPGFGIFYDKSGKSKYVFLAFSDQAAGFDGDYDDLIIKTKGHVNVVPLPAAGWLLLAGLGGLTALGRRKRS